MEWDKVQGDWERVRAKAKQRWAGLTDDDLMQIDGRRDELVNRLQELYGVTREEAEDQAENFRRTIQ